MTTSPRKAKAEKADRARNSVFLIALAAAVLLASGAYDGPAEARSKKLPEYNLVTHDMLERGAAVYAARCAVCHGENGLGDGPLASLLEYPPR